MNASEEITDYVEYLNGSLDGEQKYTLLEVETDLFKARKYWDLEYYSGFGQWNLREEKFTDKSGQEFFLLLNFTNDWLD